MGLCMGKASVCLSVLTASELSTDCAVAQVWLSFSSDISFVKLLAGYWRYV